MPESNQDPLNGVLIEDVKEDGLEVVVHQQDDDSDTSADNRKFNSSIRTLASTDLTLSYDRAHLRVVRCISIQPE